MVEDSSSGTLRSARLFSQLLLFLVPLALIGVYVWTISAQGEDPAVKAAIVNLDKGYSGHDFTVPLGRQLSAKLTSEVHTNNISWVEVSPQIGEEGVRSGKYVALLVIPANYSETVIKSMADPNYKGKAVIEMTSSPITGVEQSWVAQQLVSSAMLSTGTGAVNTYLSSIYLDVKSRADMVDFLAQSSREVGNDLYQLPAGMDRIDGDLRTADGAISEAKRRGVATSKNINSARGQIITGRNRDITTVVEMSRMSSSTVGILKRASWIVREASSNAHQAAANGASIARSTEHGSHANANINAAGSQANSFVSQAREIFSRASSNQAVIKEQSRQLVGASSSLAAALSSFSSDVSHTVDQLLGPPRAFHGPRERSARSAGETTGSPILELADKLDAIADEIVSPQAQINALATLMKTSVKDAQMLDTFLNSYRDKMLPVIIESATCNSGESLSSYCQGWLRGVKAGIDSATIAFENMQILDKSQANLESVQKAAALVDEMKANDERRATGLREIAKSLRKIAAEIGSAKPSVLDDPEVRSALKTMVVTAEDLHQRAEDVDGQAKAIGAAADQMGADEDALNQALDSSEKKLQSMLVSAAVVEESLKSVSRSAQQLSANLQRVDQGVTEVGEAVDESTSTASSLTQKNHALHRDLSSPSSAVNQGVALLQEAARGSVEVQNTMETSKALISDARSATADTRKTAVKSVDGYADLEHSLSTSAKELGQIAHVPHLGAASNRGSLEIKSASVNLGPTGSIVAALVLATALWIGAFVQWAHRPLQSEMEIRNSVLSTLRVNLAKSAVVPLIQAGGSSILAGWAFKLNFPEFILLVAAAALVGLTFSIIFWLLKSISRTLSSLVGFTIAFLAMIVTFTSQIPTQMELLVQFTPLYPAISCFRKVLSGTVPWQSLGVLMVWFCVGLILLMAQIYSSTHNKELVAVQ